LQASLDLTNQPEPNLLQLLLNASRPLMADPRMLAGTAS